MADFDGDGNPDLVGLFFTAHVVTGEMAFGLSDGTWSPSFISNFNADANMVAAKFDSDSKMDLFGGGKPAQGIDPSVGGLFLGNGDGFFTLAVPGFGFGIDGSLVGDPMFSAAGDLDG